MFNSINYYVNKNVDPDYFITFSLNRSISIDGNRGKIWDPGDDIKYEKDFRNYIRSLSKSLRSNSAWRRYKKPIPFIAAIEGGGIIQEPHIHALIKKPASISKEDFENKVRNLAEGNPRIKDGPYAVNIQEIYTGSKSRLVSYITKKGHSRLIY
jgi:hypothetical protein